MRTGVTASDGSSNSLPILLDREPTEGALGRLVEDRLSLFISTNSKRTLYNLKNIYSLSRFDSYSGIELFEVVVKDVL